MSNNEMKNRVTFIHSSHEVLEPGQLDVGAHSVRVRSLKAAREERLTISLDELPQEV